MSKVLTLTRCAVGLAGVVFLTGCHGFREKRLRETEVYYRKEPGVQTIPRGADAPVSILSRQPKNAKVLGRLVFSTTRDASFAMDAVRYNARKVGADAVVMRKFEEKRIPYTWYMPSQVVWERHYRPMMHGIFVRGRDGVGYWHRTPIMDTYTVPSYRPGHTVSEIWQQVDVDAVMLRSGVEAK